MPRNSATSKKIKIAKEPVVKQDDTLSDLVLREPPDPKPIEDQPPAPPVQVIERRIEMVMVEVPLGEPPRRFQSIHIGDSIIYGEHAQTWARLRQGLRDKDARTADGREVRSGTDILRWLLEKFAAC